MARTKQLIVATALTSLFAMTPVSEAAVLSLYEFGTSGDATDVNDYSSSDGDLLTTATDLLRGSGYGTGNSPGSTGSMWPNPTSATVHNSTAVDWRLYRKSFPTYFETEGSDGDFFNDYQRAQEAGTNYLEWTITPNVGQKINFESFTLDVNLSNTTFKFYYFLSSSISNDNYATVIDSVGGVTTSAGSPLVSLAASQFQNVSSPVTFRLWTWSGASGGSSGSAWQLDSLKTSGTVVPIPEPSAALLVGLSSMGLLLNRRRG